MLIHYRSTDHSSYSPEKEGPFCAWGSQRQRPGLADLSNLSYYKLRVLFNIEIILLLIVSIGISTTMLLFLRYYTKGKLDLKCKQIVEIENALKFISSKDPWISDHEWQILEGTMCRRKALDTWKRKNDKRVI